jgi:hypothetical protein
MRAAKDGVEWRRVNEEHDQCAARKYPNKVVLIANDALPERETVFRLDREDLRKAVSKREDRERRSIGVR